ncbi:MAG: ferrochelatase [Coriobacteriaceae bacterium]|nr:ferrochelatase [Coriobacteriaceae bacterium]
MGHKERVGVLLVNTGSPSAPEPAAVKSYLAEFLMDPCVRPMPALPWWLILHLFILPSRKRRSAAKYRLIWGEDGSPLVSTAERLAGRVEARLGAAAAAKGSVPPLVRAAMSYGEPALATVLSQLRDAGCGRVVLIPLYPQSARCTTGSVLRRVRGALGALGWDPDLDVVESYGAHEAYLSALHASLSALAVDPERDRVMFSFHAVPQPDIEAGDTYPAQVEATCAALARRLGLSRDRWTLSYQSPFSDGRLWHGPFTAEAVGEEAARTEGRLILICPGFSIDCLETLYDVERELSERARAAFPSDGAAREFVYVPCLNDSDGAVGLMAALVRDVLDGA